MLIKVLFGFLLFISGIVLLKKGFNFLYDERLKETFAYLGDNFLLSAICGMFLTVLIQSSSATIIIIIALLGSKLLSFQASLAMMMGANVGTTFTVHLISFALTDYTLNLFFVGVVFFLIYLLTELNFFKIIAIITIALFLLYQGMELLEIVAMELKQELYFVNSLSLLERYPLLGIPTGALVTAIIQSSSTFTGIILILGKAELISLTTAISLALGSNLGTCITAFLALIDNRSKATSRLVLAHVLFNLSGIVLIIPVLPFFIRLITWTDTDLVRQIANAHTIFNLATFIILYINRAYFIKLIKCF